jgi:branched-subunit amino acid aminotransferase/4-amino-4-deoxychorismate lyase
MSELVMIPPGEKLSHLPTDSAFAHGFGLFETMRLADGKLLFWEDHWTRLSNSATCFGFKFPEKDQVVAALRELVEGADFREAALKLSLVREGSGSRLYVYSRPLMAVTDKYTLRLDPSCPIFERSTLAGHKTHSYMENIYLLQRAHSMGYDDLIRVDSRGNLAETTTANLFFLQGDRLHTPALQTGILPGVTRKVLLRSCGLPVEEGLYPPERLLQAGAVFVSNATTGIRVADRIEGFAGGETRSFDVNLPILDAIKASYRHSVEADAVTLC